MTKKIIVNKENPNGILVDLTEAEELKLIEDNKKWDDGAFDRSINNLRRERNNLLTKTDWMANSDVTMSDSWKTYRQQLRDLPSGLDTVEKVQAKQFPEKPGE
tara:strand:+ start:559 stop:867 length:309 start_codon:yes stop_codon:yes gene_type:complete